jgi:hypothetical protein
MILKGGLMLKKLYVLAWFLLVMATLISALTGTLDPVALLIFSLFALGLIHALALWSVIVNTREVGSERFARR